MEEKKIKRREFIYYSGLGAISFVALPFVSACASKSGKHLVAGDISEDFEPDIDFELTAVEKNISMISGKNTRVWMFESKLIKGDSDTLQIINESYLGPVIRVRKGQKIRIRFTNKINEPSIVHWHGMHVPEKSDGHPKDVIQSGETYTYEFEIVNRAGTYWYHPHPDKRTGPQVYYGLAGMIIVTDEEEQSLHLPTGKFDIPVIIQDRIFDEDNQLVYLGNGRMEGMTGFLGNRILINGDPEQTISLGQGVYRLRILNASNSRIYKLAWEDGTPLTVIGTDGGLLRGPKTMPYIMMGVAERIDLWLDLSNKEIGTELKLKSLPFSSGMMGGMMGGMMREMQTEIPLGSEYTVMKIKIDNQGRNNNKLPEKLADLNMLEPADAINLDAPRTFNFFFQRMEWTINGRTWETLGVTDQETVRLNTTEVWEFMNSGSAMMGNDMMRNGMMGNMMQMPHPVHMHNVQFRILERNSDDVDADIWKTVKDGFVDDGWKDTVLLMPGMKIKVLMTFSDYKGLFLYHCHNLEHEDMGMMRNFKVT